MIDAFDRKSYAILIHDVFFLFRQRVRQKKKTQLFDYRPARAESNISNAT